MKVVGLDPSMRNWGIANMSYSPTGLVLETVDVIKTKPNKSCGRKSIKDLNTSIELFDGVLAHLKDADLVVVELPHGSKSAAAMKSYGICIAITACLTRLQIPFIYKTALDIKHVVGTNTTSKEEIINWVNKRHPGILSKYKNSAEHEADACVAVHSALNQIKEQYNEINSNP